LPAAIAEARGIAEANDAVNTPALALIGILNTTIKPKYSWLKHFEARPKTALGHYSIHMIASEHDVDRDYTEAIKVPSIRNGEFAAWFNSLTPDEFDQIWANQELRKQIQARLRSPGGMHEWHLVARADVFKRWGITAEQIVDLRTAIKDLKFINPTGRHGGRGSTTAHNELLEIIDTSLDYETFLRRLHNWATYRLPNGVDGLPSGLRP
jgi:hypothetical protein